MRVPGAAKAALCAGAIAVCILGGTLALADYMQKRSVLQSALTSTNSPPTPLVAQGQHLFLMNCAHCHGDDARGDEGPDLHGLRKTDARLSALINNGIKGEMPRFNQKLSEPEVQALIAFLDSLK
ncbi:MAG: cytochrome c oxidase cbb3-type subunit [Verrucomicrobiota bacterium]|jgi:mono/diheme cytochrome c family protein